MFIDYLTAAALADHMQQLLSGALVQDLVQVDRLSVALELYHGSRSYLTLSADGRREGLLLSQRRARRGDGAPTPLTLSLRSRAIGARLVDVRQPPYERILELRLRGAQELTLVAELMGRLANVILVDESGTVAACARRVTPSMTSARVTLPGQPYVPPPAPKKQPVEEISAEQLSEWLAGDSKRPAWRALVGGIRGVSPLLAREVCHRAGCGAHDRGSDGSSGAAPDAERIFTELRALLCLVETGDWEPTLASGDELVVAYAPYRLSHLPGVESAVTIATALEAYESSQLGADPYRVARKEVTAIIESARKTVDRRIAALERQRIDLAQVERLRLLGDLVLAYQTTIERGQRQLSAPYEPDSPDIVIELDPRLTPVENAMEYYKKHKSAKRAQVQVPRQLAAARVKLATLDQLATDVELADDRSAIDGVHDTLVSAGYAKRKQRGRAPAGAPLSLTSRDGLTILVGRNSRQNERVTFGLAKRGDIWLHARDVPGGHVIIKSAGRSVPESTILEAASLAAYFSRDRDRPSVPVAVTDVRHVRRLPGGGEGMARYDNEQTVTVRPVSPADPVD